MTVKWLFSSALVFEASSWAALMSNPTIAEGLMLSVLPHGVACGLLTAGLWLLLPSRYRRPLPWAPLFLFSIAFFIPLLGAIGVVAAVFPALYTQRRHGEQVWQSTGAPALPFRPLEQRKSPLFQDGGLQDVLHLASDPEQRLTALLATRRMAGHDAVPILKLALRDPADDVRLLAYSMLDQKESRINQRIEKLLARLDQPSEQGRAPLHAGLARWYWELAYLGLAQGSVLDHVLAQAQEHTEKSLSIEDNPELELLSGRIALEQGKLEQARLCLGRAEAGGIAFNKVAPFLAEAAFLSGDYAAVPALLARLPDEMLRRPPFAALTRYWA